MAIKAERVKSDFVMEFKVGVNDKGKDLIKRQKFNNLTVNAADEDLDQLGVKVAAIVEGVFVKQYREDQVSIIQA